MIKDNLPPKIKDVLHEIGCMIFNLPVLNSEEEARYWNLFESLVDALRPDDSHEFLLIKTIVDCDWQNNRYELAKARIIDLRFQEALANVLCPILEEGTIKISREVDAKQLAQDWYADKETKEAISAHLFDYCLDENTVIAEAMRLSMKDLAGLEQLIQSTERRRSLAYRDLQLWREGKLHRHSMELKALPQR
jgi:hypothetical protein